MNGVDVADQMRSYYNTQCVHLKNWKPLWHYLLDTAVTNAYKIAYCSPERPWAEHRDHHTHREFRTRLATELLEDSERIGDRKQTPSHGPLSDYVGRALTVDHGPQPIKMSEPKKRCMAYVCAGRKARTGTLRKALPELSVNQLQGDRRRQRAPFSVYGRSLCNIHLCDYEACWKEHLDAAGCI